MLKGDILMRRQQPINAMYAYKEAVELNPDFLDKKTELFQGKKIKVTVEEALAAIESGLNENPDDILLKDHLQTVYS
jgi:tetratricopeptide (TPR) repeat protein